MGYSLVPSYKVKTGEEFGVVLVQNQRYRLLGIFLDFMPFMLDLPYYGSFPNI